MCGRLARPSDSYRSLQINRMITPDFAVALTLPTYWLMVIITLALVGAAVVMHYEALERLNRLMPAWRLPARSRVLVLIIGIITLHTAEIWVFGIGIFLIAQLPQFGQISGVEVLKLLDAVYLSTTTYTSVGDYSLAPHGPMRLVLGSEALTGLVLIAWSASFTYLEMQRFWHATGDTHRRP